MNDNAYSPQLHLGRQLSDCLWLGRVTHGNRVRDVTALSVSGEVPSAHDWQHVRTAYEICFVGAVAYLVADLDESLSAVPGTGSGNRIASPEKTSYDSIANLLSEREGRVAAAESSVFRKILFGISRQRKHLAFFGGVCVVVVVALLSMTPKQTLAASPQGSAQPQNPLDAPSENPPSEPADVEMPNSQLASETSSRKIDAAWFLSAMKSRSQASQSATLTQALGWHPGDEVASRAITATGDLGIYAVCSVTKAGEALCARVVVESSVAGNTIREVIRPAT